jgi:DNA-binding NtrC family response regulator
MESKPLVLIVDDEDKLRVACKKIMELNGFRILEAGSGRETMEVLAGQSPDIILLDVLLPDCSGIDLLTEIKTKFRNIEVIVMTAFGSIDVAIKSLKNGAYDFLTKPFDDIEALPHLINKAYEKKVLVEKTIKLENALFDRYSFSNIIGNSKAIVDVCRMVQDVAYSSSTILIQGESGTGKEIVAKAIHYNSPRKNGELVAFNCSALTGSLIDSELFGHVKGAFTGAISDKMGLFEAADNSTIFLDEVGDMPLETQVRLLRVLEEGEVKAVGSTNSRKVNVRVIAATNKDLKKLIQERKFREDLYYRLGVIIIDLPPLRERKDDIPMLAYHFLKKYSGKNQKSVEHIAPEVLMVLENYEWKGNVRELENIIERGVVVSKSNCLNIGDLPSDMQPEPAKLTILSEKGELSLHQMGFMEAKEQILRSFARSYFSEILKSAGSNISKAAAQAGVERSNFKRLLKKYGLSVS